MIFDYGCLPWHDKILDIGPAYLGCLACLYCFAGISALGSLLRRDQAYSIFDSLLGWGITSLVLTILCVILPQPLHTAAFVFFAVISIALLYKARQGYLADPFWPFIMITGIVFLLPINLYGIGKWDDFSHWVPNALYLWRHDGIPGHGLPSPYSVWPGYPYALPFLTYLASRLAGGFLVAGGAMFNFLFLAGFAATLPQWVRMGTDQTWFSRFAFLVLALLSVTLLNPAFNASFTMTSQGDTGSMIVVGAMAVWLCDALANERSRSVVRDVLGLVILGCLLVLIKQANIGIFLFLVFGFLIAAWKNRRPDIGLYIALFSIAAAMVVRALWQHDVATQMNGNGFAVQPLSMWRWDLSAALAQAVLHTIIKKCGCFILTAATIILGLRALSMPVTRRNNFFIIAAIAGAGYLAFLMACYLGTSFSEGEIRSAASFYRYGTHLGLLGIVMVWMVFPDIKAKFEERSRCAAIVRRPAVRRLGILLVLAVLPTTVLLAPSVLISMPNKTVCALRHEALDLVQRLPGNSVTSIVEPDGDGFFAYVVNFELALNESSEYPARFAQPGLNHFSQQTVDSLLAALDKNPAVHYVYVRKADPTVITAAGESNHDAAFILARSPDGWAATKVP